MPRRLGNMRVRRSRGLTLAEAIVCIAIVGTMLVAALTAAGGVRLTQVKTADRARGLQLAQDLLTEITTQAYEDPDYGAGSFGLGADEIGDGSRALWEDVDDYDGWVAAPPQEKDGTPIPGCDGWERRASVDWVSPDDLLTPIAKDLRLKRIVVTVLCRDVEVATLTAVRAGDLLDARHPDAAELDPEEDLLELIEIWGVLPAGLDLEQIGQWR